jgi:cation:H+ antiporter
MSGVNPQGCQVFSLRHPSAEGIGQDAAASMPLHAFQPGLHHCLMQESVAWLVFLVAVAVMSWASVRLTMALECIGARLRFSEGLLGVVTALGADAPEICSASVALLSGHNEVGVGVVLGSNIFNLAALLGLSAIVAGRVNIGRQGLWLNGGTSLIVSLFVVALVLRWIPVGFSLALMALALVPYVGLLAMRPAQIAALGLPLAARHFLGLAVGHAHRDARQRRMVQHPASKDMLWLAVSLALVIASSIGAVRAAVWLGNRWGVSHGIIGMLALAALTSLPNVIAAVQLAREGRGAAVVSETLNSNTLNILAGLCLPALVIGFAPPSGLLVFAVLWLLAMKIVALAAASGQQGLRRGGGVLLVVLYLVFAGVIGTHG